MKLLAVLFLVGFALASAIPAPSHELSLDDADDLDLLLDFALESEGDDEIKTKLQEKFYELLEKVKVAIEKGKEVREDILEKLKETRNKMKERNVELGKKAKELLQKLKEKAKDYWKKILDNLIPGESARLAERGLFEEVEKIKFNGLLNLALDLVTSTLESGKNITDYTINRIKELIGSLRELGMDAGKKVQKHLEKHVKNKDMLRSLLKRLGLIGSDMDFAEEQDDVKTELGKKLRDQFDELLEKLKDAVEKGRKVKDGTLEKLKEMKEQMKDLKVDIGNKAKELIEKIKKNGKDYWKKILEKLRPDSRRSVHEFAEGEDKEPETELGQKLKKHLEDLLEKIKDAIDHGKTVKDEYMDKVKQIREKLKDMHLDISTKAKELFENIKEEGRNYWRKILEKLGLEKRALEADDDSDDVAILREKIGVFLKKVKEAIENNEKLNVEEISRQIVEQYRKLKNKGIELSEKDSDLIRLMGQKIKEYFQKQLEKIGKQERSLSGLREKLRELKEKINKKFDVEEIKARIENYFGKDSEIGKFLIKLTEKGDKAKQKLLDFIDKILGEKEETRSIKDVYEKVKEYLKNMKIELKEKFSNFGEWAFTQYEKGLEKGKDRAESLKKLAKEFIDKAKHLSRDVIDEAKEFFKEYKDDLGIVYEEVVTKIEKIVKG